MHAGEVALTLQMQQVFPLGDFQKLCLLGDRVNKLRLSNRSSFVVLQKLSDVPKNVLGLGEPYKSARFCSLKSRSQTATDQSITDDQ
jgi:hypothetical protein